MKKYSFTINGNKFNVNVNEIVHNVAEIEVNGTAYTVTVERDEKGAPVSSSAPIRKAPGKVAPIATPSHGTQSTTIKSPLPGSILKVLVEEGQSVKRGDVLMTMESMKMENNITAEEDGVVKSIFVTPGQNVMQDDKLISLEGTSAPVAAEPVAPVAAPKSSSPVAPVTASPSKGGVVKAVKAPLPGSIMKILVTEGQAVNRGDVLLTMESMKMENNILAEANGVIRSIKVTSGQNVMQDDVLLEME